MNNKGKRLRGAQLLRPWGFSTRLDKWWWLRRPTDRLQLGNVSIPHALEYRHIIILGSTGTGKTTIERQILRQLAVRNTSVILVDPKGELTAEFYQPSREDFILNPFDERSPFWSPWDELRPDSLKMDLSSLIESLIRRSPKSDADKYWYDKGRELLKELFVKTTNIHSLYAMILKEKGDGRETAKTAIEPLLNLRTKEETTRQWSALQWATERKGWLFLTPTSMSRAATRTIQGIWIDLLIRRLLERPGPQTFFIADEPFAYQPNLEEALATGRSFGLCLILGLQNIAQLRRIYGHDSSLIMADQPATMVFLGGNEPQTAKWGSSYIGEYEVEGRSQPVPLVMSGELQTLPDYRGYIVCRQYRAPLKVRNYKPILREPGFIPRAIMQPVTRPISNAKKASTWRGIWQRINDPNHNSHYRYGGRGIKLLFDNKEQLFEELGDPPADMVNPSVGRWDPDGPYGPGNVHWEELDVNRIDNKSVPALRAG